MNDENVDLIIFAVAERIFALESQYVYEIMGSQALTKLPFVEGYIDGLVSVDGRIATQINLELYLSGKSGDGGPEELIILKLEGNLFALKIGEVLQKIEMERASLQLLNSEPGTVDVSDSFVDHSIVQAEFEWNSKTAILLNGERFLDIIDVQDAPRTRKGIVAKSKQSKSDGAQMFEESYLIVQSGLERFAFLLEQVVEIIPAQVITPVPGSPLVVLGVTVIRGAPLLMLSVEGLLGEQVKDHNESGDFLILNIEGKRLGLVFDKALGINKFSSDCLHQTTISSNKASGVLIEEGDNINGGVMTYFEPDKLIDRACFEQISGYIPSYLEQVEQDVGETLSLLLLTLNKESYAIPVEAIKRIISWSNPSKLDDDYLKESELPIVGLTELEGSVIPVINILGKSYDTSPHDEYEGYVIIGNEKSDLAISFNQAQRLIEIPQNHIESFSDSDNQLLTGIANYNDSLVSIVDTSPLLNVNGGLK